MPTKRNCWLRGWPLSIRPSNDRQHQPRDKLFGMESLQLLSVLWTQTQRRIGVQTWNIRASRSSQVYESLVQQGGNTWKRIRLLESLAKFHFTNPWSRLVRIFMGSFHRFSCFWSFWDQIKHCRRPFFTTLAVVRQTSARMHWWSFRQRLEIVQPLWVRNDSEYFKFHFTINFLGSQMMLATLMKPPLEDAVQRRPTPSGRLAAKFLRTECMKVYSKWAQRTRWTTRLTSCGKFSTTGQCKVIEMRFDSFDCTW